MIAKKRDDIVEDFLFMSSIIGQPCALYRLAKVHGVEPSAIQKHLRLAGVEYRTDLRGVPA